MVRLSRGPQAGPGKRLAGWKAYAKGAQDPRCAKHRGHVIRYPAQCPPLSLVSFYSYVNVSPLLLYLFFSGKRRIKHFLKINSSSNTHFPGDNSHHLLSSNDLSHLHASPHSSQPLSEECHSPGFTGEETEVQRGGALWTRPQKLISGHGSPILPAPDKPHSSESQSPASCPVHQMGLPTTLLGGRRGRVEVKGGAGGSQMIHRIPSPPGPAYKALVPSLPNPRASTRPAPPSRDPHQASSPPAARRGFSSFDSQSCKAPGASVNSGPFAS